MDLVQEVQVLGPHRVLGPEALLVVRVLLVQALPLLAAPRPAREAAVWVFRNLWSSGQQRRNRREREQFAFRRGRRWP